MKRDKTDALFSRLIKLLSGGYCKRCKNYLGVKSRGLHCAHLFSRGKRSTRFEREAATALCYGCHSYLDHHPLEKTEFFMELLGAERYAELELQSNTPATGKNKLDIEAIEADLKEKINKLEEE